MKGQVVRGREDFRSEVVSALSGTDLVDLIAKLRTEAMFHSSLREGVLKNP